MTQEREMACMTQEMPCITCLATHALQYTPRLPSLALHPTPVAVTTLCATNAAAPVWPRHVKWHVKRHVKHMRRVDVAYRVDMRRVDMRVKRQVKDIRQDPHTQAYPSRPTHTPLQPSTTNCEA